MFTRGKRDTNLDTSATRKITPGPGTYRAQSDFGYYDINDTISGAGGNRRSAR